MAATDEKNRAAAAVYAQLKKEVEELVPATTIDIGCRSWSRLPASTR
ncbi:MAG: hypothetical protein J2P17_19665 [Mycobacterium sp.]|nr:hypothetical protein [Mycobacterium sp.]